MGRTIEIKLTSEEREELEAIVARRSEAAGLVRGARVILLSDRGVSGREIALRLDLSPEHVSKIRGRFRAEGGAGLAERPASGRTDHAVPAETVERSESERSGRSTEKTDDRWRGRERRSGARLVSGVLTWRSFGPRSSSWLRRRDDNDRRRRCGRRSGTRATSAPRATVASSSTSGSVVVDDPYLDESAAAVALTPDGRIVVAGESIYGTTHDVLVRRFLGNGSRDVSFGTQGAARPRYGYGDSRAEDVVVLPDAGVVVVGNSGEGQTMLVRYTCIGAIDEAFGVHGAMRVYLGDFGVLHTARLDPQGRLLLGGADVGMSPGPGTYGVVIRMWM